MNTRQAPRGTASKFRKAIVAGLDSDPILPLAVVYSRGGWIGPQWVQRKVAPHSREFSFYGPLDKPAFASLEPEDFVELTSEQILEGVEFNTRHGVEYRFAEPAESIRSEDWKDNVEGYWNHRAAWAKTTLWQAGVTPPEFDLESRRVGTPPVRIALIARVLEGDPWHRADITEPQFLVFTERAKTFKPIACGLRTLSALVGEAAQLTKNP